MTKETFKTIPAYPNYAVSKLGRVRRTSTGHIMKPIDNGKGYKTVKLYNQTKPQGRLCLIHRVVLSTYQPIDTQMDVNHIDGNKANNTLVNLEWVTKSENTRHAHLNGQFSSRNKLTINQVREIKQRVTKPDRETFVVIAADYGVKPSIISKIANGKLYGYV